MSDRCWILAGGPEDELPCIAVPQDAFVLCADSGLRLAERLKITPALVLGDFDSLGALPEIPYWQAPVEKDDTDTMLAVRYGLARGYRDFVICGAFGGRLDHTYANIQTLCFLHSMGAKGLLVGARDLVNLQPAGKTVKPCPGHIGVTRQRADRRQRKQQRHNDGIYTESVVFHVACTLLF